MIPNSCILHTGLLILAVTFLACRPQPATAFLLMDGSPLESILKPTVRNGEGAEAKVVVFRIDVRADVMFFVRDGFVVVDLSNPLFTVRELLPTQGEVTLQFVRELGERSYGLVVRVTQAGEGYRLRDGRVALQDLSSPSSFTWDQSAEIGTSPQRKGLLRIRLPEDIVEQALFWRNWSLFAYGKARVTPTPRPLPRQTVVSIQHTVGPDHETLETISEMYDTPVETIRKLNPDLAQPLTPGQKVIVPLSPEKPKQGAKPNP
jgi:hypothetical protein